MSLSNRFRAIKTRKSGNKDDAGKETNASTEAFKPPVTLNVHIAGKSASVAPRHSWGGSATTKTKIDVEDEDAMAIKGNLAYRFKAANTMYFKNESLDVEPLRIIAPRESLESRRSLNRTVAENQKRLLGHNQNRIKMTDLGVKIYFKHHHYRLQWTNEYRRKLKERGSLTPPSTSPLQTSASTSTLYRKRPYEAEDDVDSRVEKAATRASVSCLPRVKRSETLQNQPSNLESPTKKRKSETPTKVHPYGAGQSSLERAINSILPKTNLFPDPSHDFSSSASYCLIPPVKSTSSSSTESASSSQMDDVTREPEEPNNNNTLSYKSGVTKTINDTVNHSVSEKTAIGAHIDPTDPSTIPLPDPSLPDPSLSASSMASSTAFGSNLAPPFTVTLPTTIQTPTKDARASTSGSFHDATPTIPTTPVKSANVGSTRNYSASSSGKKGKELRKEPVDIPQEAQTGYERRDPRRYAAAGTSKRRFHFEMLDVKMLVRNWIKYETKQRQKDGSKPSAVSATSSTSSVVSSETSDDDAGIYVKNWREIAQEEVDTLRAKIKALEEKT